MASPPPSANTTPAQLANSFEDVCRSELARLGVVQFNEIITKVLDEQADFDGVIHGSLENTPVVDTVDTGAFEAFIFDDYLESGKEKSLTPPPMSSGIPNDDHDNSNDNSAGTSNTTTLATIDEEPEAEAALPVLPTQTAMTIASEANDTVPQPITAKRKKGEKSTGPTRRSDRPVKKSKKA